MRRREFIAGVGAAAVWPRAMRAQLTEGMRHVGVLMNLAEADALSVARLSAFLQGLQQLGWIQGQNMRLNTRWGAGDPEQFSKHAAELIALAPNVILTSGASTVGPLLRATRSVPIVFVNVVDPVGAGFVDSLSRPGRNATGFTQFEYGISGKWLELLKQIAPTVTRAAIIRDPAITAGIGQFAAIQSVAPAFAVELRPIDVHDTAEIERAMSGFASVPNGGLIVTGSALTLVHRELIVALAARHKLPAVYWDRIAVTAGGLVSYGPDTIAPFRRAAGYVDRIFKGENPADMPVLSPTKYEVVVNLRTAKALNLTIPNSILSRADEVIE